MSQITRAVTCLDNVSTHLDFAELLAAFYSSPLAPIDSCLEWEAREQASNDTTSSSQPPA